MEFKRDPDFMKRRVEAMKAKKDEQGNGGDYLFKKKYPKYTVRDGENIVRLLPATWKEPEPLFPWLEAWIHYSMGVNNSAYFCLAKMLNKPCPFNEEANKMSKSKDSKKEDYEYLLEKPGAIVWLIDRLDESKGPQLWIMPYTKIAKEIVTISFNRRTQEPVFVDDIEKGWDLIFNKAGKLKNTQYSGLRKDDEATPLHADDDVIEKWMSYIQSEPIPDILNYKPYDYLKGVLEGTLGSPEEAGDKPITSSDTKAKESAVEVSPPKEEKKSQPKAEAKTETKQEEKKEPAKAQIPVGDGLSLAKVKKMDRDELLKLVEDRSLDINPADWQDNDEFSDAIALELGLTGE